MVGYSLERRCSNMAYANQKTIRIFKEKCDKDNIYSVINNNALQSAMIDLKKSGAFKLWVYLSKNQNGFDLELSAAECQKWGIKESSYHNAVKELIYKGYLQLESANRYIFYEQPKLKNNTLLFNF